MLQAHDLSPVALEARGAGAAGAQLLTALDELAELALERVARTPATATATDPMAEILNGCRAHLSCDDKARSWFVENAR
jgi:hypothetical protein